MENEIRKLFGAAGKMADSAVRTTSEMMVSGKQRVDRRILEGRLAKMQQQLGALVYVLRKTGEENEPMVEHYVAEIDRIKLQLDALEVKAEPAQTVRSCPECGGEVPKDAMFCRRCGSKLP